jgi:hypothetical protein
MLFLRLSNASGNKSFSIFDAISCGVWHASSEARTTMRRWFSTSVSEISMRIDLYTKAVLTVIALLLAAIVFKQYASPDAVALAQGPFAGVQFTGRGSGYRSFFDTRTGEGDGNTTT